MNEKVLVVDDETDIRNVISVLLSAKGYSVVTAANGVQALDLVRTQADFDLILLDIMMPGLDGIETCHALRKFSTVPVLFLTAKSKETDKATAYGVGGDDYLSKPFSSGELLMKVESMVRRYCVYRGKDMDDPKKNHTISFGGIEVHPDTGLVYRDGAQVDLTETERKILFFMLKNRDRTVSVQEIYESVWQERYLSTSSNSVMVHILRLRKKIEDDPANPTLIRTVWGRGYQFG